MKIEGSFKVPAPRAAVWEKLLDPQVLARAMPGCEKLELSPEGGYRADLKIGIASVKGSYRGRIEILDPVPPERFRIRVEGQGSGGFLKGEGILSFVDAESETTINYSGEAQVGGVVASVGQRLVLAAAKQIVNQFFGQFSREFKPPA